MFFLLLCILILMLLVNGVTIDAYGWMMLVGCGWFAGYMDSRLFHRSDRDVDRVLPPDVNEASDDRATYYM